MNKNNPSFKYKGHTFEGVRLFSENENFAAITRQMRCPVFPGTALHQWSYSEFYDEAQGVGGAYFDIFLMDGLFQVIPAHNGLWIWGQESDDMWVEKIRFDSKVEEMKNSIENFQERMIVFLKFLLQKKGDIILDFGADVTMNRKNGDEPVKVHKLKTDERGMLALYAEDGTKMLFCEKEFYPTLFNVILSLIH